MFVLEAGNRFEKLRDRREAVFGLGFHALMDGCFKRRVDFRVVLTERWRGALAVGHRGLAGIAALPGEFEGEELVHRDAVREDIQPLIGGFAAHDFGGHVVGCAGAIAGEHEFFLRRQREAKVDELERRGIFGAHKVARADIAMDVAGGMDGFERFSCLSGEREAIAVEQFAAADEQ